MVEPRWSTSRWSTSNRRWCWQDPKPIPSNKLLLLTLNRTGSNFEGVGMLRPVWWWWRTKQRVSNMMCVGLDRWAIPTPKVIVDRSVAEALKV
jgi:hypothetical protein